MTLRDKTVLTNVTSLKTIVIFENTDGLDVALSVAIKTAGIDCQTFIKEDFDGASALENINAAGWPKLFVDNVLVATGSDSIRTHLGIK